MAAAELIHKAAQALRRSPGAQSNFHQAVADLESFETVLRKVEALSTTTSRLDTTEAIRLCAFKCHPPLDHFLQRVRAYEPRFSQLPDPKTQLGSRVTGSFWKIKWAVQVEEEVAKLKAAIGPQLVAIGVLLQVKDIEQSAAACQDITQLLNLTQNVTSGIDRMWLAVQDQALATKHTNLQILDMQHDTQACVQQLPQLATSCQLGNAVVSIEDISARLDSTATKDQADEQRSLLQSSSTAQVQNHTESMAVMERYEAQTAQMASTIQAIHGMLAAARLPNHSDPHAIAMPILGQPVSMPPPSAASPSISSSWRDRDQLGASNPYHMLSAICRLLVSAVMAMVLMLPNIQSQFRTFMTLLKSPRLLSSNGITVTDALNRTKLLPYEYFSNWSLVQPWLESTFKDLPGESRVRRGEFEMFVATRNGTVPVIRGESWKRSVFPGDQVVMSMQTFMMKRNKCTRCGHAIPYQVGKRDWVEW